MPYLLVTIGGTMTINKATMFKNYFLVMKILAVISAVIILKIQLSDFHWSGLIFGSLSLFMIGLQFFAMIKAQQLIEEKNYLGIIIGLFISVMYLGSIMLPFGIWGLYCLLNREFMKEFSPNNAPAWFEENIIQSKLLRF